MRLNDVVNTIDIELGRLRRCSDDTKELLEMRTVTIMISNTTREFTVYLDICNNLIDITRFFYNNKKLIEEVLKIIEKVLNDNEMLKKITTTLTSETETRLKKVGKVLFEPVK